MAASDSRTIKSAHRVLEILEYFDQMHTHATVMDLARSLSYPQSSTSELLRCLTRLGYLHYNRFRRTYSPTARVALLGAWVKPSLFRGGPLLDALDELCEQTGETVIVSAANNYQLQHLHVVLGSGQAMVPVHVGDTAPLLHSAQGKLLLSSYPNENVRSVLHRMNADEPDPARHVRLLDFLEELDGLRASGWAVSNNGDGTTGIAALLPPMRGVDRIVVSLIARTEGIESRSADLLAAVMATRDRIIREAREEDEADHSNVVPINQEVKVLSYRRHYA